MGLSSLPDSRFQWTWDDPSCFVRGLVRLVFVSLSVCVTCLVGCVPHCEGVCWKRSPACIPLGKAREGVSKHGTGGAVTLRGQVGE